MIKIKSIKVHLFFSALSFLPPELLEEGHFFLQFLEPGDIRIRHKHPNSVTHWPSACT